MKRAQLIFTLSCFLLISACTANNQISVGDIDAESAENVKDVTIDKQEEIIKKLNNRVHELTNKIIELENEIKRSKQELEHFAGISNLTYEFTQALSSGETELISPFLAENLFLSEKGEDLYLINSDQQGWEWKIKTQRDLIHQGTLIQGFDYDEQKGVFQVFTRQFFLNQNNESLERADFLVLEYKLIENEWKVIDFAYDV